MILLPHSFGGYTLQRKLGTGGVAESYVGTHDSGGGRRVVVRRILPFILRDAARLGSIDARVRDLLGVRHPFLVQVVDHLVEDDEHFIVEEYVPGVTLEQVLTWCRQSGHHVPHNVFLNIATQICNGLEALHGRSGKGSSSEHVLHLSLKPGAIFLTPEGKVLLGGYGLTRSPTTYPQGGVAGPVPARMEYLSPEQTHPDQKLGPASDIFALGSLLYELLTLESMFRDESNLKTIHRVRRGEVATPLLQVKERLPGLDKILFRALALNPRHRYQRAFVLREDLRGLMAGYSFATISEDTRTFLTPILAGAAEPVGAGYVVGLDDAPADADAFADSPDTSIDADPLSTAAHAAAALAERVARERAAEAAPENTERTEAQADGELTPLPTMWVPAPTDSQAVPTAVPPDPEGMGRLHAFPGATAPPTWIPDQVPDSPPFGDGNARPPDPVPDPASDSFEDFRLPLAPEAPDRSDAFPRPAGRGKGRKPPRTPAPIEIIDPPAPSMRPPDRDAALPSNSGQTLAPDDDPEGTVATPAPEPAYPPEPVPRDVFDELAPPPSGGTFFTSALVALGAILLCAGSGYWAYGTWNAVRVDRPDVASAPAAKPPPSPPAAPTAAIPAPPVVADAEDPAAVLAAITSRPAGAAAAPGLETAPPPVAAPSAPPPKPSPVATPKPAPAPVATPKPASRPKPEPVVVAPRPTPKPKPKPEPVVVAPKPRPEPVVVAKKAPARPTVPTPAEVPALAPPPRPSLDIYVDAAKKGRLSSTDVAVLRGTPSTDAEYSRSRALLMLDAQKRGDDKKAHAYLDDLMVLPENHYNPVFLADYARWYANRGEYDRALEKAQKAERYWARIPSELVYTKKAEIYEIEAASWQGKFYKSGEDLDLLESAVRGWERYKAHVGTRERADLTKKADTALAQLADIRARLQ
ncbi:MAG: serine/threonine protein kinase [Myxococcales bacterium]|nr:serine/threonine protein kinase [Myxococcales bacterium]